MNKKYQVTLTESERAELDQRVSAGTAPARDLTHVRILLKADRGPHGPAWKDEAIATALDTSLSTIARVRQRFAEQGLTAAVRRRPPRREYRRKLDEEQDVERWRQAAAECGQDQPVARAVRRALGGAPQHANFVAQGKELDVPGPFTAAEHGQVGEQADDRV